MKPLRHQEKFVSGYKDKDILTHEGGTGKTVCACLWLRDGRDANALVICPKRVVRKWQRALYDWGTKAHVVSKEQFKKLPKVPWSAVVVDEADEFASPLFVAKSRSQLSSALYDLLKMFPETPRLLLTATPVRSNPWNLHTLLTFKGHYIDWKKWREEFFSLQFLPYMVRPAWMPKPDWKSRMRPLIERHTDVVNLRDCVDLPENPPDEEVMIKNPKYVRKPDDKPFFDEHRHEQVNKADAIIEIGRRFRKVIVVAFYREQIEELECALSKDKETFVVYGGSKDQEGTIAKAQDSEDCYLIMQSSTGVGSDCDRFSCMVFASTGYSVRDHEQMRFRTRRIHNLKPVKHYYLVGGRCDRAVLDNIKAGNDFLPNKWKD